MGSSSGFDEQSLQIFYSRLFPYEQMFDWLSYSHDPKDATDPDRDLFYRREFSFTKANDVYIRYLSFKDANEFKERVKKDQPHKIDIGAVYSFPAKDHATVSQSKFRPLYRELVFDVDLTDYEEVQTKGTTPDKSIWSRNAWLYMACAIKVVDSALREDFGFEHLLWVFSGRRGVHCWVCDDSALKLEDNERTAIVEYLTLITGAGKSTSGGGDNLDQRIRLTTPRHPSVRRAVEICRPMFLKVCISDTEGQGILATEERWQRVLAMVPNVDGIRETLANEWRSSASSSSSEKRWNQLEATVKATARGSKATAWESDELLKALDSIVLFHVYPRLDVNVSTHRNHLLKSPFVVHPKTGNVCVPILNVQKCESFDPDNVPTLQTLIKELEDAKERTSLNPILDKFESQFLGPLKKSARARTRSRQEKLAAVTGAW